uniref:6-phosphogluconate dehydrogenase n=1 Tax=Pseudomonas syringae TaxID=317 RepID=I6R485_PSESX|nr:6-phosphogluconate dehydrogenase [Pseudomonas syringae]5U5G_A Chain A, 6-phosphogluconate dehydrogenase [Pseudomonas syringae]5U5G_B Chain B, 6-phosphogluconate dehydrogenase [Pseudomonas syringae]5U5G_C Chain C, 6-phosphogluconate dehydrogenase [Pseudomonas syringae]5U5G_D Chain D, 6-phosphogluconate dehydrogenase [Pseudomonas syringae]
MNRVVGFIGLGRMGQAICRRLLASQMPVHVHNRSREKADDLIRQGAVWAPDIVALTRAARVLFVCTAGSEAVQDFYHAPDRGLLACLEVGDIVVDLSTIAPETAEGLHAAFAQQGADYIECPVSGGVEGALAGILSAIVSGRPEAYGLIRPLLEVFCATVTYVPEPGKAQRLKILNNLAESINLAGAIEVISQGLSQGLDLKSMADVFTSCRGRSAYMDVALGYALSGGASSNVSLGVRCKDLELARRRLPQDQSYPFSTLAMTTFDTVRQACGEESDQCQYFSVLSHNKAWKAS